MNEFKGTKGKWFINEHFLQVGTKKDTEKSVLNDGTICRFNLGTQNYKSDKETAYNALLISKAPEMLEMLNTVLFHDPCHYNEQWDKLIKEVEKLIKEATELK